MTFDPELVRELSAVAAVIKAADLPVAGPPTSTTRTKKLALYNHIAQISVK